VIKQTFEPMNWDKYLTREEDSKMEEDRDESKDDILKVQTKVVRIPCAWDRKRTEKKGEVKTLKKIRFKDFYHVSN
jgi:hypothetical protein